MVEEISSYYSSRVSDGLYGVLQEISSHYKTHVVDDMYGVLLEALIL